MGVPGDIAVNLAASLMGVGAGWALKVGKERIRARSARRFWTPFMQGQFHVVLGCFSEFRSFEQSGLLGVGDARALAELETHFASIGLRNFRVSYAHRIDGDALQEHLLCLGGPDANTITREAVTRIPSKLRFGDPVKHEIAITDVASGRHYVPSHSTHSSHIINDYGMILRTQNPFAPSRQLIVVAGSFGYGTWAGVRFLTSKDFYARREIAKPFEALVESAVVSDTPQTPKLIVMRQLT